MSTIAYKDGIIARDSRRLDNGQIVSDKADKLYIMDNVYFFLCGCVCDYQFLIDAYFGKTLNKDIAIEAVALVVDGLDLYEANVFEGRITKVPLMKDEICAYGTGGNIALGAMESGKSAVEAVEIAKLRDSRTGGEVRTFTIHDDPVDVY